MDLLLIGFTGHVFRGPVGREERGEDREPDAVQHQKQKYRSRNDRVDGTQEAAQGG